MIITENLKLNKIELKDSPVDITVINPNWDTLDTIIQNLMTEKVDIVIGKGLSTEDFTTSEKDKLRDIEIGANKYIHPETHAANMITGLHTIAISGSYEDLIDKPLTFHPSEHTHDDRYYTETEIDSEIGDLKCAINESKVSISTNSQQINDLKDSPDFTGTPTIQGNQIATTEKMPFYITPSTGYEVILNNSHSINNVFYINFSIKILSGYIPSNAMIHVATMPFSVPDFQVNGTLLKTGVGYPISEKTFVIENDKLMISIGASDVDVIRFNGVISL